ncbi:cytochrome c biogenesis protein CcsA, partial [Paenibacillus darwinianus]
MSWLNVSSDAFIIAFFLYCFAFLFFAIAVAGRKWSNREPAAHMRKWSRIAFSVSTLGLAAQLTFFFTRWAGAGHIPTSNMYEFISFLGMAIMIAFTIVYLIYRSALLGMFTLPLTVIIIAYAAVFPQEVQPLVPALQSNWLKVHVTTAALGEAFFAVGFAAGLMYLLRVVDFTQTHKAARRAQRWLEFTLYVILVVIAFILTVFAFRGMDYTASFAREDLSIDQKGVQNQMTMRVKYTMPPIVKPYNSEVVEMDSFLGMKEPLFEAPSWMNGVNAGRKLNTVVWSILAGALLYGLVRL